ncbi:ScpA/B protein, partial [Sphaeroforma arctica JP610]
HVNKFAGPSENVTFKTMVPTKTPKSMASKAFYQMLVLANMGAVELHQNDPYSDINIRITHEMV